MHNNGTTPQPKIILPDKRLLPDMSPQAGIELQVVPQGIIVTPHIGDQKLSLCLDPVSATQLGVNLISASAVHQQATARAQQAGPPPEPEPEIILS